MLHRACKLPADQSCLLLGPRQTGKSTLVRNLLPPDAWTVDLLEHDTFTRFNKDPAQFRREAQDQVRRGATTVFVDEVQKIPVLLDEIHGLIEATGARFLLTGSSARKLRRGGTNLLAGRAAARRLHPLTWREQGEHFDLDRTLKFGSLPRVVTSEDSTAIDVLRSYSQTYLREEIQSEALVRNLGGFARFLDVVAGQCGDLLNASAVARDAQLATRTVQEYFQLLVDTLVGFRLEPWAKSPRTRMVAHPRFYLFDTGVTNALNLRLTAPMDPASKGRLFEQWIVLECQRLIDYAQSEARLFFWRTHNGAEVDLLVEKHGSLRLAVEVKSKPHVSGADLSGMRAFLAANPSVPARVACLAPNPHQLDDRIEVLPWRQFFDEFESLL